MTEIQVDLSGQILTFWIAGAAGVGLCLVYDLFRLFRLLRRPSRVGVFVQDVLWWAVTALVTYGLLLVRCKGVVRLYALLGEAAGFLLCRGTLSRGLMAAARPAAGALHRLGGRCRRAARAWLAPRKERLGAFAKKICEFLKNLLKRLRHLLYNFHIRVARKPGKRRTKR